jgi:hypothetical protein
MLQPAVREYLDRAHFKYEWMPRYGTFAITMHRGFHGLSE